MPLVELDSRYDSNIPSFLFHILHCAVYNVQYDQFEASSSNSSTKVPELQIVMRRCRGVPLVDKKMERAKQ